MSVDRFRPRAEVPTFEAFDAHEPDDARDADGIDDVATITHEPDDDAVLRAAARGSLTTDRRLW